MPKEIKMTVGKKTASFNAEHAAKMTKDEFVTANAHVFDTASLESIHDKCTTACNTTELATGLSINTQKGPKLNKK